MSSSSAAAAATTALPPPPPPPARRIVRLDPSVVNRIAAGEVIQRPSSALKEMLENCLDAGSTAITVAVKAGGLKVLQVTDNGCGIAKEDFPLVCERFATSKLARFEDLTAIRTYGFRGEALASISHVARVSVTSMPAGAKAAYRAAFADGRMLAPPAPCAGVKGTAITVEEMFHNVPARRAAFKASGADEYARILEVMQRYALHTAHRGVAFTCKKLPAGGDGGGAVAGGGTTDLHIAARTSVLDAVGVLFGTAIKRELLPVSVEAGPTPPEAAAAAGGGGSSSSAATDADDEEPLTFSATGYVSNANYGGKKGVFVLFINDRLVDCGPLRRAVEGVYADVLPRGQHPWVYLALALPPSHVDVNVHPTKREVAFLHTDALVAAVAAAVGKALGAANASRTFYTQTLLPLAPVTAAGASTAGGGAAAAAGDGSGGGSSAAESDVASLVRAASGRVTGGGAASGGRFGAGAAAFSAAYAATPGGAGGGGDGHASHVADGSCCGGHGHGDDGGGEMQLDGNGDDVEGGGDGIDALQRGAGTVTSATRDGVQVLSASAGAGSDAGGGGASRPETGPSVKLRQQPPAAAGGSTAGWTISYLAPPPAPGLGGAAASGRGGASAASAAAGGGGAAKPAPNKTVRVDLSHRGLDVYLQPKGSSSNNDIDNDEDGGGDGAAAAAPAVLTDADVSLSHRRAGRSALQPVRLVSVREVLSAIDSDRHAGLARLLPKLVFVGLVGGGSGTGAEQCLAQADTRLLLLNYVQLTREVAYQQAWRLFANLRAVELAPPLDVAEMAELALGRWARALGGGKAVAAAAPTLPPAAAVYAGVGTHPLQPAVEVLLARHGGDAAGAGAEVAGLLASKAPMLDEYFSIRFREVAIAAGKRRRAADVGGGGVKARRSGAHPMHAAAAASAAAASGVIVVDDSDDEGETVDDTEPEEGGGGGGGGGDSSSIGSVASVQLTHLPRLLDGHTPQLAHAPDFLLSLALTTDWTAEKPCFHGVAQNLAHFYAIPPPAAPAPVAGVGAAAAAGDAASSSSSSSSAAAAPVPPRTPAPAPSATAAAGGPGSLAWTVEHVLLPAFRRELSKAPPRKLGAGHYVVQVACTEQLYRIFERC